MADEFTHVFVKLSALHKEAVRNGLTETAGAGWGLLFVALATVAAETEGAAIWRSVFAVDDEARIIRARDLLFAGRADRNLAALIEYFVDQGRRGKLSWTDAARLLVGFDSSKSVDELARRLEGHYVAPKQGRTPKGKWTTAQIAAFIIGETNTGKRVVKARRKK